MLDKLETILQLSLNFRIAVEDKDSRITFFEAEIDFEFFAKYITGSSDQPIKFGIRGINNIGKKVEIKTEVVTIPDNPTDNDIDVAVKKFEVNGWVGRRECCKNHHNLQGPNHYAVHFHRWVESE